MRTLAITSLDSLVPQEAKSALLENAISGSALWSLQKNPGIGIHFTLFWPTDVPAEDLLEKKKEEQSEEPEKTALKRARPETPKSPDAPEDSETAEPPAKKAFSNDSGTSSPTEKLPKTVLPEEPEIDLSVDEQKEEEEIALNESSSEKAEEICTENCPTASQPTAFPFPPGGAFQPPPVSAPSSLHPNALIQSIQNQILQAAIQRRKLLEEEQKRILSGLGGAAPFNQPTPAQRLPMPLGIPPNPLALLGNNAQPRFPQVPPSSFAGLTHSDIGLPREGEAVFRDKYIWSESVKKYLCSVCGYSTPYRSNIIVHLPKHYPELRRFRCPICSKRYGRKDLWKSHLRSRHPEVADIVLSPSWHSMPNNPQALKTESTQNDALSAKRPLTVNPNDC
ncbi:Oidioi.mRNA.OKI2018_I69.chr1.g1581.t1.cds [Oikopleura dioica]|uniref:Oidioi.mRNA.OKI2018_I69.chr1.g1581.t1.cds n=1 Tax=Oikopleura dioica TaxID=34765 RepID=A0ABN7STF1_OIKDI|nr:Oidioi.mRNA.OKI2018_I69.chr1.g1581.t1.cds [Oikopleura dioica]